MGLGDDEAVCIIRNIVIKTSLILLIITAAENKFVLSVVYFLPYSCSPPSIPLLLGVFLIERHIVSCMRGGLGINVVFYWVQSCGTRGQL